MDGERTLWGTGWLIAAAIAGAIPFLISMSSSSYRVLDGEVVYLQFRDWIAIGSGALAVVMGLAGAASAWCAQPRAAPVCVAMLLVALGSYQIARGFGVLAPRISVDAIATRGPSPIIAAEAAAPHDAAVCPDPSACDNLAADLDHTDPRGALDARTRACELGDKFACLDAAQAWDSGTAGPRDAAKALALRARGCDLGAGDGCVDAGAALLDGDGVPADPARGRALLQQGCDLGSKIGCADLAFVYQAGDGVPADRPRAVALATRACDDGNAADASVAHRVGEACALVADAARDSAGRYGADAQQRADTYDRSAVTWFDIACKAEPKHCFDLAVQIDQGRGIARDAQRAREVYRTACGAGSHAACNNLGIMLDRGEGGARDSIAARELFERACQGGHALACTHLEARR